MDIWLTTKEAAKRAKVGRHTVYDAVRARRLRAATRGRKGSYRFKPEWIDAWLESLAPVEIQPVPR